MNPVFFPRQYFRNFQVTASFFPVFLGAYLSSFFSTPLGRSTIVWRFQTDFSDFAVSFRH